ncbi:MAG TPA: NnrS family protein [Sphingomicrobium sp.]|nr:NnrS family protein [Sphingomicrobium sp.]
MNVDSNAERRVRLLTYPPVLRAGFRPFFLLAAVWAIAVVALWLSALAGSIFLPTRFDPLSWHRHEMLFGFVSAAIAGFLLTAIPNWTGRLPISGVRLAGLVSLWMAARLAILFSVSVGGLIALIVEAAFLLALAGSCAREVIVSRNRNIPIVGVILLFAAASAVDHLEMLGLIATDGLGWRGGFALVLVLITLIGGRIIPSFTANWLIKQGQARLPGQPSIFDHLTIGATVAALGCWAFQIEATLAASLLFVAGLLQVGRLARWGGWRTAREPLVLILHVAYAWLPMGLLLLGLSIVDMNVPGTAGLHALGAGAMASMVLAVMTRATLGHTGRELRADGGTVLIYSLATAGAAVRVSAPWLPFDYLVLIKVAGALWGGAFLLFLAFYGPKLVAPRPDGKP